MKLIIPFLDQSSNFVNGVELGRILHMMEINEDIISNYKFPIHDENIEVINTACNFYNYIPSFKKSVVDGWTEFSAIKNYKIN